MSDESGVKKNIVGENIRKFRQELMLSQRQVVDMMNMTGHSMTPSALSKIEKGKRGVSDMELQYFSKIFNTTVDKLF